MRLNSIRDKLNFMLAVTTLLALVMAGLALVAIDIRTQLRTIEGDLVAQADVIGLGSAAPLAFDDTRAATENLGVLRAKGSVASAALYDETGKLFAAFHPEERDGEDIPLRAHAPGISVDRDWVRVWRPVIANRQRVGTVYLEARHELLTRALDYLGVLSIVLASSLAAALLLSNRLQTLVTGPIANITEIARRVRHERDFSLRAQRTSDDEIGELADVFNAMLDELGARARTLEHANEALRAGDERKDEFIATLAHELRNPLAPIRTGLEILKKDHANGPPSQRARETMDRQLAHMIRLIDDLLDISRINSGKIRIETQCVLLAHAVESALEISRPRIEARGHALHVHMPDRSIQLVADGTRIAQALGNLLNNAAKYTPPGGRIDLDVRQEGSTVVMRVRDNGVGIPRDMLENVFSLFTQVGRTLDRAQGGLGIGLYLVRSLVEMHGGTVSAESAGPGQGSTFSVRLPCLQQPAAPTAPVPAAAAPTEDSRAKVLVVDDNVDAAETLCTVLEMSGRDTMAVHDGTHALDAAAAFQPDVVLLDLGLPGLSGYDVARQLRGDGRFVRTVLIAVTGWGGEADRRRSREAGFDGHLTKPVDLAVLEPLLRRHAPDRP